MKTNGVNLIHGQVITLGELTNVLNIGRSHEEDQSILNGEKKSLHNFNGKSGIAISFSLLSSEGESDSWELQITDTFYL